VGAIIACLHPHIYLQRRRPTQQRSNRHGCNRREVPPPGGIVGATTRSRAIHCPPSTSPMGECPFWLLFCRVLTSPPCGFELFAQTHGDTRTSGTLQPLLAPTQ
jgi:hypothetical protein